MKSAKIKLTLLASIFFTMVLLCSCSGGGSGGGSTTNTAVSTITVSDTVQPLEIVTIPITLSGTVTSYQQTGGPAVSNLSYANGNLSFFAPAETGSNETLQFDFLLSDNTTTSCNISMTSRIAPVVTIQEQGGTDGTVPIVWSDLNLFIPSLIHVNVLPGDFTDFSISFTSTGTSKVSALEIYLHNGTNSYDISNYFTYDQATGVAMLNASSKTDFIAKLSDAGIMMTVSGHDSNGAPFSFEVNFYYGTNTINGKIVNSNGSTVTTLTGKTIALTGFTTGSTRSATIAADGTFSMTNVVTDNYSLTLVDPTGQAGGSSMFLIQNGGSVVNVNLTVMGSSIPITVLQSTKSKNSTATISENTNLPVFQKNIAIEPRSVAPDTPLYKVADTAANVLTVSGAAMNVTVQNEKNVTITQGTKSVVIKAVVTTAEYPGYSTKPGNKFNDTWSFSWSCAGSGDTVTGLVNSSHSATGTRTYEYLADLSSQPANSTVTCNIKASTVNIGDGAYPTTVTISVEEKTGFAIRKVYHKSGLFSDRAPSKGNGRFNMGIPLASGTAPGVRREWVLGVDYQPKEADIKSIKVELQYNGIKHVIGDIQGITNTKNGFVKATLTLSQGVPLTPAGNQLANVLVTLTGEIGGVSYTSQPKAMLFSNKQDSFQPLFEINNLYTISDTRRFGNRSLTDGSDAWGRLDMLTWLTKTAWTNLPFNDISGEHAWQDSSGRSLGEHVSHKGGYDVDARYYDEDGVYISSMRGDGDGASIRTTIDAAQEEYLNNLPSKPNLLKLIKWIKVNRTGLTTMANDSEVFALLVGVGTQLKDKSIIPWHRNALLDGLFPDGLEIPDISLPQVNGVHPMVGKWSQKPGNIIPVLLHEGHIHVRLTP